MVVELEYLDDEESVSEPVEDGFLDLRVEV